jgi:hypothetical protein
VDSILSALEDDASTALLAVLVGALIAAIATIAANLVAQQRNAKRERSHWLREERYRTYAAVDRSVMRVWEWGRGIGPIPEEPFFEAEHELWQLDLVGPESVRKAGWEYYDAVCDERTNETGRKGLPQLRVNYLNAARKALGRGSPRFDRAPDPLVAPE